ncbi:MAG: hypothetical protein EON60_00625 [Alphaproteobacteria bacterium]|nr:MAG: hypothetical protein EON60_00625 [Alphaproteobacteria bacterium]
MNNLIQLFQSSTLRNRGLNDGFWNAIYRVRRAFVVAYVAVFALMGGLVALTPYPLVALLLLLPFVHGLVMLNGYVLGGVLGRRLFMQEDPALRLVRYWRGPTDRQWMDAFEPGLDADFPHWRTMLAQNPHDKGDFVEAYQRLKQEWLSYKPNYSTDLTHDAFCTLITAKQRPGPAQNLHRCYHDWEIAQTVTGNLPMTA